MTKSIWAACAVVVAVGCTSSAPDAEPKSELGVSRLTLVGCVEFEKDYRARIDNGKGGPLGTGLGGGNEFVLSNAVVAPLEPAAQGVHGDYYLTGKFEDNFRRRVNTRVEVIGTVKDIKALRSAEAAKELAVFEVESWHPSNDFCEAPKEG